MHPHDHAAAREIVDQPAGLPSVLAGDHQLRLGRVLHPDFGVLVDVTIGVTGDGDGLLPSGHAGRDSLDDDRRAEHCAIEHGPDGAVGALPHLFKAVLLYPLGVGGDGGAFDAHAVFLDGVGRVYRHLVVGVVPMPQPQVVVFALQIHKRGQQLVFDSLPENTGHFVPVHLHQRRRHGNFLHTRPLLLW